MSDKSDFDHEMSRLEAEIKRLEVEYNMFFAGWLPRLPWETRGRVEQLVKRYDRMNLPNTAQRFRFSTVQARFMAFCELWERNLRNKEEGRGPRGRAAGGAPPGPRAEPSPLVDEAAAHGVTDKPVEVRASASKAPPAVAQPRSAPSADDAPPAVASPGAAPITVSRAEMNATRIRDLGRDSDRVTALYDELTRARLSAGETPMPFDRFATVLKAQLSKFGAGTSEVDFRVSVNQGKVTLSAKKVED
jgi:hypothetical protein